MKKAVMVIALVLLVTAGVFAQVGQTYYYKYVETVNTETGVRINYEFRGTYITFTKNSCYESDEKGIQKKDALDTLKDVYSYQGEENNQYVFRCHYQISRGWPTYALRDIDDYRYYYFSKDYKRMNYAVYDKQSKRWNVQVHIYEQAPDPAKQGSGPPGGGMW